jgi:hypothetical protein
MNVASRKWFQRKPREEYRDEGSHTEREEDRPYPHIASEQPADTKGRYLDRESGDSDIDALSCKSGHQAVARTRSKTCPDVEPRSDGNHKYPTEEQDPPKPELADFFWSDPKKQVDDETDDEHIQNRSKTPPLAQWNP